MRRIPLRLIVLLFFIASLSSSGFSQLAKCPCGETLGSHVRIKMKNRSVPSSLNSTAVSPKDMIAWAVPSPKYEEEPATPYAKENSIYTVKGYAHIVKISEDDCDIHIELSSNKGNTADRIIAEIPNTNDYCAVRDSLLKALKQKYHFTGNSKSFDTKSGFPKLTITGYAFWDTAHWSKKGVKDKKGHAHGSSKVATLWEIHPILSISVE